MQREIIIKISLNKLNTGLMLSYYILKDDKNIFYLKTVFLIQLMLKHHLK